MHIFKRFSKSAIILLVAFVVIGAAPAFAQRGSGEGVEASDSSTNSQTSSTEAAKQKAQEAREAAREAQKKAAEAKAEAKKAKTEAHDASEAAREAQGEDSDLSQRGDDLLEKMRKEKGIKAKTPEERQKKCEARKAKATANVAKMSNGATTVLSRIDGIYAKALEYKTTNSLNPDGIDALIATADANKASAAAAVSSLQASTPSIDCTTGKVANQMASYKVSAQDARDKLKTYRSSVKAVLQALKVQKPTTTEVNTGANQ